MSEPELSYNQALQEITRFGNIWQAVSHLKDALRVAARVENDVKQFEARRDKLTDEVSKLETWSETRQEMLRDAVSTAESAFKEQIESIKEKEGEAEAEHKKRIKAKEQEVNNIIGRLEDTLAQRRQDLRLQRVSLDKDIHAKQAMLAELEAQVDSIRKRVG